MVLCAYCHRAIDCLIALRMKELMQSYARLALYDSHTHKPSLLSPLSVTANTAGRPVSPAIRTKSFSNQKVQLHTPGLLRAWGVVRVWVFLWLPSCVQKPYCRQAAQGEGSRQQVAVGYRLRWLNALHKYVFAHICSCEREGKDNESCVAIATKRKVTPHPSKCCWESVALVLASVCLNIRSAATASLWNPGKTPTPRPPTPPPPPLPADRRIDCSCSASLSSVRVLRGDHQRAEPGVFHPRPESSTLPSIGWKGSPQSWSDRKYSHLQSCWLCVSM